ncbi:MAG TPA: hypothetical protein VMV24_00995 [Candidatus Dormibacteraeota bacterium]|jgi:hypothetical protein|nr:hypothetical protein [Candidatus Dormibacteraeota bacterium]
MTTKTLPTPLQTNEQVREYIVAVEKGNDSVFISASNTGWNVMLPKDNQFIGTFRDKATALNEAKKQINSNGRKFFVFNKIGELIETV